MGKYFDGLVELVKGLRKEDIKFEKLANGYSLDSYLEKIVKKSALFEISLSAKEIYEKTGKTEEEYLNYLLNYSKLSQRYDQHLVKPFPLTAIEDKEFVTVMDNLSGSEYLLTTSFVDKVALPKSNTLINASIVLCTNLKFSDEFIVGNNFSITLGDGFVVSFSDETGVVGFKSHYNLPAVKDSIISSLSNYINQLVYITHPKSFIIKKESNDSIVQNEKEENKQIKLPFLRKTINRPIYVCLTENETTDLFRKEKIDQTAKIPHLVRGHWRILTDKRFVNFEEGDEIFVRQYCTGKGEMEGNGKCWYRIMVKEDFNKLVPYEN